MSVSSISAVIGRINEIRAAVPARTSSGGFQSTLDTAMVQTGSAPVRTKTVPTSDVAPIGMLGTPIVNRTNDPSTQTGPVDGEWQHRLPAGARRFIADIELASAEAGVDPRLVAALVWTESGFDPDAVSHAGAIGLAQLMPGTADGLGVDPHDPLDNLRGGARFLAAMIDQFGSIELGLAAYNAGPGRVARAGGIPHIPETQAYVPRVLERYELLGGHT